MKYERRAEWYPTEAPFNLEPSAKLDEAWDDLLYGEHMVLKIQHVNHAYSTTPQPSMSGSQKMSYIVPART